MRTSSFASDSRLSQDVCFILNSALQCDSESTLFDGVRNTTRQLLELQNFVLTVSASGMATIHRWAKVPA